ncbi:hypothetical protein CHH28_09305 [Bacterioplanes sanyensis]|uniref:cyclic-guanylate-specific phosphodiesterase n=1 Tax=Bacterioplanes sanyensis TaxID=1249553 RepID=A0A222FJV4_9GAMM|nr:EAL domain-containing protein [Bacterioplanes sanyensis]ASP38866.1 hypothetical protein CHH28_09305 [Bacterioplanes sanyensis]
MRPHSAAQPYRRSTHGPASASTPLFLLSFFFLATVLALNAYQQWHLDQQHFKQDIQHTLSNYSQQAGLLAKASLHTNKLFSLSHAELMLRFARESRMVDGEQLQQHLQQAIFHYTGFFLLDDELNPMTRLGRGLHAKEVSDMVREVALLDGEGAIFSLRYGQRGGYYIYTPFEYQDQRYHLVVRRTYSQLSEIVYQGGFDGYELLLIDRRYNTIAIRDHYYANSDQQPPLRPREIHRLISREPLAHTPWDIAALPVHSQLQQQLWQRAQGPLLLLTVFAVLIYLLWRYLKRQARLAQQQQLLHRESEIRAERALIAIDEALISTDQQGHIDYLNPRAQRLLSELGHNQVKGTVLMQLWPEPNALWNQLTDLNALPKEWDPKPLVVRQGDEWRTLQQDMSLLYDDGTVTGAVWLLRDITEQVEATQALQDSRSRYKTLFQEAGIAHCLLDISQFDGQLQSITLIDANDAALTLFAAQDRQQLLDRYPQLLGNQGNELERSLLRAQELQLTTTEFELRMQNFTGQQIDLWANLSFRSAGEGQALLTFIDITENKRAHEEIKQREAFWARVMSAMPDLVYVIDLNHELQQNIIFKNRTMGDLLGYPEHHALSQWYEYAHPDDQRILAQELAEVRKLEMGSTRSRSARFIHFDGSTRILKFTDTPFLLDDSGLVTRYIGTARDVTEEVEKQEHIVESERRYRLLAENMSDIIWATDTELNMSFISSSVQRLLGYQPDELMRKGIGVIFSRKDLRQLMQILRQHLHIALRDPGGAQKHNISVNRDMMAIGKSGTEVLLELNISLLWNEQGDLQGFMGLCRDVTAARKIEQELQLAAEVFENSNEAILITDQQMNIASINQAFTDITGYEHKDVIGQTPDFLISPKHHSTSFYEDIGEALVVDGYWQGEITYQRSDQERRVGWAGVSAIRDQQHQVQSLIIIMSDVTERKVAEERIHRLAYYDPLTGLPNRSQMHERFDLLLRACEQAKQSAALLFIDLDRFKPINDSMGHPAGDRVLKEVAERLQNCIKKHDLIARMGGDEFTIAIGQQSSSDSAADTAVKVGERILHALHQPYFLGQREVFISASIGISIYPHDGHTVIELLKNADLAMYHAKDMGRDNVQFYDAHMNQKAVELLELENDLRHALERGELELYFQPQHLSQDGRPVGVEALLRWHHPRKGLVSPGLFIPIMEDTGMIVPIGRWVLAQACETFASWQSQGLTQLQHMAVNVSARQFHQTDFVDMVRDILTATGIQPQQLELELTESVLIDDIDHTLSVLKGLNELGVHTAIDDFGTGYSSLNYLKQFPVDTLKIDRSFIQNLPDNNNDAQITRTIIAMAHNLGMRVIAEGVETEAQYHFLERAGCEMLQGFLFSRPLPEQELLSQLDTLTLNQTLL